MKGKQQEASKSDDGNGHGEGDVAKLSEGKPEPGDLIWTKLSGRTWWPALVLEEDTVRIINKRRDRSDRDVFVRLYGSSTQLYVDPMKYRSQFDTILERNNGRCHEILWKSLQKELPHLGSDPVEGGSSTSKGTYRKADSSKQKKSNSNQVNEDTITSNDERTDSSRKQMNTPVTESSKKGGTQKKLKPDDQNAGNITPEQDKGANVGGELSARRVKVMRTLGLVPPSGSPF